MGLMTHESLDKVMNLSICIFEALDSVFDIKNEDISPSVQIHMEQTNQLFYDHFQGQI